MKTRALAALEAETTLCIIRSTILDDPLDVEALWAERDKLDEGRSTNSLDGFTANDPHLAQELHHRANLAKDIVQELLRTNVLSVETLTGRTWRKVLSKEYSPKTECRWKWTMSVPVLRREWRSAVRSGQAKAPPCLRFIRLPNPHAAIPLAHASATTQDGRPGVVAVKSDIFYEAPAKVDATGGRRRFFRVPNCPFAYIRKHYPAILKQGEASNPHRNAIKRFINWFSEQARRDHLDLWRFCWPELRLTVEGKLKEPRNAMLQELVYMRQHRRTQPWMRSVIGLAVTTDTIALLRADTLGVEQCIINRESSRGVLDSIRLCLGLVLSNGVQRGRHEAFQLAAVKTLGAPHVWSASAKRPRSRTPTRAPRTPTTSGTGSTTQPAKGATPAPRSVSVAADVEYTHRIVRFITLDGGDKIHYPKDPGVACVRYYVHHLVYDDGSLVGRCPRIFCVSREDEAGTDDKTARFVGPYALKIYYADHASECYRDDLIGKARREGVKNVLLPTWEWRYGDALTMRGYGTGILLQYTNGNAVVPNVASNCEEVFAQTDLKRVLAQCRDRTEFAKAFIDFAEGIASLEEKKLVHRDLSIGNVLLKSEPECPVEFWSEAAASAKAILNVDVTFTQRTRDIEEGGLLHDMDMAGVYSPPPPTASNADAETCFLRGLLKSRTEAKQPSGSRMGTYPFMAIELLRVGPPHLVVYDLHSLFFVLLLFLWTYERFSDVPFPGRVPTKGRPWPPEVKRWADRPMDTTLVELMSYKAGFFSDVTRLTTTMNETLKSELFCGEDRGREPPKYYDRNNTTPAEVKAALEEVLAEWEAEVEGIQG
ncbi:hypothetical protein B0H13DRAFT_2032880 [Mycena leptocephala]|nr:hypothetical protein B0H13DRAFT_2032880 [Mycena leptocephala]